MLMVAEATPVRQIRAVYRDLTITVYQAYPHQIANEALELGRFGTSFSRNRMTWIKPSFLWMMYRSGWATKANQERILSIQLSRQGFEWALRRSGLSHYDEAIYENRHVWEQAKRLPVRVQWDPERDLRLRALPQRSLQVGLSGEAVRRYVDEWIQGVEDVTKLSRAVAALIVEGRLQEAEEMLPPEVPYPLPDDIAHRIGVVNSTPLD